MARERFKLIAAVHLLLFRGDAVLLSRRFNTGWEDGKYSVPAGHLDGEETVTAALVREVQEEIGVVLEKEKLNFTHVMHRVSDSERFDFFFTIAEWNGEPKIMEPDKCDDLQWFPIDALPPNMVAYVRAGIEHSIKKIPFSEFGWN